MRPWRLMASRNIVWHIALLICLTFVACTDAGQPPLLVDPAVRLQLIDVAVTEAYLHLSLANAGPGDTVIVQCDGATLLSFLAVPETTITDTGLAAASLHEYRAVVHKGGLPVHESETLVVHTLAPSSHNFSWRDFTFGGNQGSSYFLDAAIVNDTLAYAVGAVYLTDSAGAYDPDPYNLAVWNGARWTLHRVTVVFQGNAIMLPLDGIWVNSADDIWLAGGIPIHGNGNQWTAYDIRSMVAPMVSTSKMWGTAKRMYFAGRGGTVLEFSGNAWQQIESGTTDVINDVWGAQDPLNGKTEVYCAVTTYALQTDRKILRISDSATVDTIGWSPGRKILSVWTNKGFPLYTAGDGVFENSHGTWREHTLAGVFTSSVRGSGLNDLFVCGDFGMIAHFNGLDWHIYNGDPNSYYASIHVKGNLVLAVGGRGGNALITMGRR